MKKLIPLFIIFILTWVLVSCGGHTHSFGQWEVTREPTCSAEGEKQRMCECGEKEVLSISKTSHSSVLHEEKPATCEVAGQTAYYECTECGYQALEPEEIPALGHVKGEKTYTTEPTCQAGSEYACLCVRCDKVLETGFTEAVAHAKGEKTYTVLPTCVNDGVYAYLCVWCGTTLETGNEPPLPHTKGTPVTELAPTCTSTGLARIYCTECDTHMEDLTLSEAPHSHGYYTVKGNIYSTDSRHASVCSECGSIFDEQAHTITTVNRPADYLNQGERYSYCTVCGWEGVKIYQPTLEQLDPEYVIPSGLVATFGDTLSNIALPLGFSFEADGSTPVGEVGERIFTLTFTPPENPDGAYKTVTGIPVSITVMPFEAELEVDFSALDGLVYNGAAAPLPTVYSAVSDYVTVSWYSGGRLLTEAPRNAGEYVCEVSLDNPNCLNMLKTYTFTIGKASRPDLCPDSVEKVYDGTPFSLEIEGIDSPYTIKYFLGGEALPSSPVSVGEYTLTLTVPESANYLSHTESITLSIIPDSFGPTWEQENSPVITDADSFTLSATDHSSTVYFWVTVYTGEGVYGYDTDNPEIALVEGAAHYVIAIDGYGNRSDILSVYSSAGITLLPNEDPLGPPTFVPESIYPEDGAVVDTPYVHLYAEKSVGIYFGTSPDINEMQYSHTTKLGFPFIDYLEEGVTYYWCANAGAAFSEIYSFTYSKSGADYSAPALVSPEDGATVTDPHTPLIATGNGKVTVYFKAVGYDGDFTEYNYFDNGDFEPCLCYEWYAVDSEGNETEKRTFLYLPDLGSNNPEGIVINSYPDGSYIKHSSCMIEASTVAPHGEVSLKAVCIHRDGSYSFFKYGNHNFLKTYDYLDAPEDDIYRELLTGLKNGDTVYYYLTSHLAPECRSEIRRLYVDTESPVAGSISENGDGTVTLLAGSDNMGADYYYRLYGGEWIKYTDGTVITPDAQRGGIELSATDRAGNRGYAAYSFGSTDISLPTVTLSSGKIGEYTSQNVTLTLTPTQGEVCYYVLDGTEYPLTEETELTISDEGEHTLCLRVAGERDIYTDTQRILIDKTAPRIDTIYAPENYGEIQQGGNTGYALTLGSPDLTVYYQTSAVGFHRFIIVPISESFYDLTEVTLSYMVEGVNTSWKPYDTGEAFHINLGYYIFGQSDDYNLKLRICDEAGNETVYTYTFRLDREGPTAESATVHTDRESGKAELRIEGIADDRSEAATARIYVMNLEGWHTATALIDEVVDIEGDRLVYDLSELPCGEIYFVIAVLYDNLGNYNILPMTAFYKESPESTSTTADGLTFERTENGVRLVKIDTDSTLLVLPDLYEGESYTVYTGALLYNDTVEEVVIKGGLKAIEWGAFASSRGIRTVYFEGSRAEWDTVSDGEAFPEDVTVAFLTSDDPGDPKWQYGEDGATPELIP